MDENTRTDERLRPYERLRNPREFRRVFQRGRAFRTPDLRIHFVPSPEGWSRMGLVVRRRLGKAVRRNRVKRLLREIFRKNKHRLSPAYDVVLVPENEPRSYQEYLDAFESFASHIASRQWTRPVRRPGRGRRPRAQARGKGNKNDGGSDS